MLKTITLAAMSSAIFVAGTAAQARVAFFGSVPGNFYYSVNSPLPINGVGTSVSLNVPKPGKYAITFSAECSVTNGVSSGGYAAVVITVDGAAVAPLSDSAAFCTVPSFEPTNPIFTRASATVGLSLSAGVHYIQVEGRLKSGATTAEIGDSAIVIEN